MLGSLLSTACLALGAGATATQAVPAAGERLPPVALAGLSQTGARSFAEFYGRAVLIEFFAHWCAPSATHVPRLNALADALAERGLAVLLVTREDAAKTVPWIQEHGVRCAYAYDPTGELHRRFAFRDLPFAVLVDPTGAVVWSGLPRRLGQAEIERALADALPLPVWEWPEEARALAPLLQRGEFAAARRAASALPARADFDAAALVDGQIALQSARFERLIAAGDPLAAFRLAARLEGELATLPEAAALAARVQALRADPAVQLQVARLERLGELEERKRVLRGARRAEKLREEVQAYLQENAGNPVEPRARILLDSLDRFLARVRKNS